MATPRRVSLPNVKSGTLSTSLTYLRELKRKYRYLYSEKHRLMPDGSVAFHQGRLWRREGHYVVHLKGDAFEMAFQHGKLLSDGVRHGVLMQLSKSIPNLLYNSVSKNPLVQHLVVGIADYMGSHLKRHIPWDYLAESFALSEGSGLAMHHVSNALLAMESMYILAKYAVKTKGLDISPMAFAGCSSVAAWAEHAEDGELVIGRNLDYPLNGYFDEYPTVTYYEPTDQGQRYIALGTAGLHTPSLTAINESGIYIAGHLIPTAETSYQGTPMYFVAADVIKHSRTFDEAVRRFREHRTTVGWSYVLASAKEKRVASVEMTNQRVAVRESQGGFHFQTNHFSLIESSNLYVNRGVEEDTRGRYQRLESRARAAGRLDARTTASILADSFDPWVKRDRGLGATVAVHITVGSAVLLPDQGRLFVATGKAPTCQNSFFELPLFSKFDPATFAGESYERIPAPKAVGAEISDAVRLYVRAKMAYEYDSDAEGAYELMKEVTATDPQNTAYHFVRAVFAMKLGHFGEAVESLSHAIGLDHTSHLRALSYYYRGRIHASHSKIEAALGDFQKAKGISEDVKLQRAIEKAIAICKIFGRYPFRAEKLPLMMQFADLLNY